MSKIKINQNKIKPAVVEFIEAGSIGEEVGFEVGDKLISINGIQPRDLIDYKFLIAEEKLQLNILDERGKILFFSLKIVLSVYCEKYTSFMNGKVFLANSSL